MARGIDALDMGLKRRELFGRARRRGAGVVIPVRIIVSLRKVSGERPGTLAKAAACLAWATWSRVPAASLSATIPAVSSLT
jgi:hypothetical protein